MAYRMLVSDLDGTLLNDRSQITPGNRRAILAAMDRGVQFVICSGRSYRSLDLYEKQLELQERGAYGICFNGGMVYETASKRALLEYRLEATTALAIVEALREMDIVPMWYIGPNLYAAASTPLTKAYSRGARIPLIRDPRAASLTESVSKVIVKEDRAVLERACRKLLPLAQDPGKGFNMLFSSQSLLEFGHPQADKGAAVTFLADYLGIPLAEVICAGDNQNDLSMLRAAGLGVAVQNAVPEAKAAAGYVTERDNNRDAFREIVGKFFGA